MNERLTARIRRVEKKAVKPGEIWSIAFVCTACAYGVRSSALYCEHCGARLLGVIQ